MRFGLTALVSSGTALASRVGREVAYPTAAMAPDISINLVSVMPAKRFLDRHRRALPSYIAIVDHGVVRRIAIDHLRRLPAETLVLIEQSAAAKGSERVIVAEIL